MRISDWSSDVCSSDLIAPFEARAAIRNEFDLRSIVIRPPRHLGSRGEDRSLRLRNLRCDNRRWNSACGSDGSSESRSEEHTSELQSLMRISYAVFCLKKKKVTHKRHISHVTTYRNIL